MIDCPKCGAAKGDACRTFECGALKPYQGPESVVAVVKPFTPDDAKKHKAEWLPNEVIESVNELLAKNFRDGTITIKQKDLEAQILTKMPHLVSKDLYDRNYLDIEESFRQSGWDVHYDKPGYDESYDAYFEFKPKRGVR
jgi:hypothetical protein